MIIEPEKLLTLARGSIEHGLREKTLRLPPTGDYPQGWYEVRASFVTIKANDELRGCIGTTEAIDPLMISIVRNAYAAAFNDPRFSPLTAIEYSFITISLALLTPPEPLAFTSESELLEHLVMGEDGLIIEHGDKRATFLPSVWESLPDTELFLRTLKQKGGLPLEKQPQRAWRYRSEIYDEVS